MNLDYKSNREILNSSRILFQKLVSLLTPALPDKNSYYLLEHEQLRKPDFELPVIVIQSLLGCSTDAIGTRRPTGN